MVPPRTPALRLLLLLLWGTIPTVSFASTSSIPVIDLAAWTSTTSTSTTISVDRDEVVAQIGKACTLVGFFAIQNHGVNASRLDALWKATLEFFDLALEIKLQSKTTNETEYPYGYEQSETLVVGKNLDNMDKSTTKSTNLPPPDPKETFSLGPSNPLAGMPPRRFPPQPPGLETALCDYYQEMEQLATTLLQIFALALNLPQDWFQDKMTRHMSALRLLNYFSISNSTNTNTVRAGAHTDYGALTILKPGGPGLQVKVNVQPTKNNSNDNDNNDGEWMTVPYLPDTLVVNLGDLMQRWTNDLWVSTLHRVVSMPLNGQEQRRQSIAYFVNIDGDTPVETLETCIDDEHPRKYPMVLAKDHLMAKHLASMRHGLDAAASHDDKATGKINGSDKDEL